jgi:hypothetical protein
MAQAVRTAPGSVPPSALRGRPLLGERYGH